MNVVKRSELATEFTFRTSRSSGAGGQHVNKTETKVELIFDVQGSKFLSAIQKNRIEEKVKSYMNDAGELKVSSSESRSQLTNKERAIKKFFALLERAFKREKTRIPTTIPPEKKLVIKKKKQVHSEKKKSRQYGTRDFLS